MLCQHVIYYQNWGINTQINLFNNSTTALRYKAFLFLFVFGTL